ncbi:hypothetical protein MMC24_001523 [Lignoscripta atroalba]|nr:hypothetical protein [Lignoscripta atroalba]
MRFLVFLGATTALGATINHTTRLSTNSVQTSWGATCTEQLVEISVNRTTDAEFTTQENGAASGGYDLEVLYAFADRQVLVSNTYNVSTRLCVPGPQHTNASRANTVQLFVHRATFDKLMWDIPIQPERYSWTKKMNEAGFATFSLDLPGTGNSSYPEPLLEANTGAYVSVVHQILGLLRAGSITSKAYTTIVYTGYFIGGIIGTSLSNTYPSDVDALILLAIAWDISWAYPAVLAGLEGPAADIDPARWGHLSPLYMAHSTRASRIAGCFYGAYDPEVAEWDWNTKATNSIGEAMSFSFHLVDAPDYTGPVFLGLGNNDATFCAKRCGSQPYALYDKFPSASAWDINVYPDTGHSILYHYSGAEAMQDALGFLDAAGL